MGAAVLGSEPTGLYGWIQSNDARSLKLFGGFALAVQLMAAGLLLIPLALFDEAHSPLYGLGGYLSRYVPLILVLSAAVFAVQMFWYMQTVRNSSGFVFVDDNDEPRLCRILEPLLIAHGMKPPFVAVIETDRRNAFACGISRRKSVLVVTRGLLQALTDDELEAVLAHELAHIRNGDIRLMAAANICMRNMREFKRVDEYKFNPVAIIACLAVPALFPLILLGCLVAQIGMRWAFAARLAITSSREFIADAEAAEWTKNPAALASALLKVEGRHRISDMRREDDAMMIAGESEGKNASHPDVQERIDALARITGSMVFNAPGAAPLEALGDVEGHALLRHDRPSILQRARAAVPGGLFGFSRRSHYLMLATIAAFLVLNVTDLGSARAMAAKFDVRPVTALFEIQNCHGRVGSQCSAEQQRRLRAVAAQGHTLPGMFARSALANLDRAVAGEPGYASPLTLAGPYTGESGKLRGFEAARNANGDFAGDSAGTFSSRAPDVLLVAEIDQVGCFPGELMYDNPDGQFPLDKQFSEGFSMKRLAAEAEGSLITYGSPGTPEWREWLLGYAEKRENLLRVAYDDFGLPGLRLAAKGFASDAHAQVLAQLRHNVQDPAFTARLDPLKRAKVKALARDPAHFVPCRAIAHGYAG